MYCYGIGCAFVGYSKNVESFASVDCTGTVVLCTVMLLIVLLLVIVKMSKYVAV